MARADPAWPGPAAGRLRGREERQWGAATVVRRCPLCRLSQALRSLKIGVLEPKIDENVETGEGNNRSTPSPHRMVGTRPSSPLGCLRVDRTQYGHSGSDLPLPLGEIYPRRAIFRVPRTLQRSWAGRVWLARGGFMLTTVGNFRSRAFQDGSNF